LPSIWLTQASTVNWGVHAILKKSLFAGCLGSSEGTARFQLVHSVGQQG